MSQQAVEHCLGRLITDDQFRRLAQKSLPQACRQFGFVLTPIELELLAELNFSSLAEVARCLNPGLHRTGIDLEH
jgi:hypothetical protein